MQLIASLAQVGINSLADSLAGADAGLLRISKPGSGAKTLQKMCRDVPGIPWGGWLGEVDSGGIKELVKARSTNVLGRLPSRSSYDPLVKPTSVHVVSCSRCDRRVG